MLSRRQISFVSSVAIAALGAAAIWFGAAAIILAIFHHDAQAAALWLALAKAASLAWVGAVGWLITWRRLDERERETRKLSWFIGSTTAILLTAPIMLFWLVNGGAVLAHILGRRGTPGAFFALGWIGLVFVQMIASSLARAGLWATTR
jgi:hypothetical protein